MTGSLFMQHTPSRFTKVARAAPLQHAHPGFTRFMAAHPRLSLFVAEHPKASRFVMNVARHIPVLVPHTAMIIAHAASVDGAGHMGATYDHRVLNGADAVKVLQALTRPTDDSI